MQFTSERHVDDVIERDLTLAGTSSILWLPAAGSRPMRAPLLLAGQPGGHSLEQTRVRLRARAQHAARAGFASVTLELPGSGARPAPYGVDEARSELRAAVLAGEPVGGEVVDRLVLPIVDQAVPEWQAALDVLLRLPEIGDRVGVSGGLVSVAVRLAATDSRVAAAGLFAGSFVPRSIVEQAPDVTVPVHVLLQWDDEDNDREMALALFDALGSQEKTLVANLGGHTGVPAHAGDDAIRFFARHLRPAGA